MRGPVVVCRQRKSSEPIPVVGRLWRNRAGGVSSARVQQPLFASAHPLPHDAIGVSRNGGGDAVRADAVVGLPAAGMSAAGVLFPVPVLPELPLAGVCVPRVCLSRHWGVGFPANAILCAAVHAVHACAAAVDERQGFRGGASGHGGPGCAARGFPAA